MTAPQTRQLEAKVAALEKLVIELTLISMRENHHETHQNRVLDMLLGELQYAGLDEQEKRMRVHEEH